MNGRLTLGYKASAEQFGPQELLELAVLAEEHGFDSVMVSDHFHPWRHHDGHAPHALTWLGAVTQRTSRVLLGTSVLTPTFRYNPAVVAQSVATLGCLAPGRIILGVGSGESMNELPVLDIEWPEISERTARLKEAVELIKRLWTEERVTFDGQFYKTKIATIYDRPDVPPKIYLAAAGPAVARMAGRIGDGFICTSGKGMELYRDTLLPAVLEGEAKAGRPEGTVERMLEVKVSFDPDRDRAMADTRIWAALALPPDAKMGVDDPLEMEQRAAAVADQAHRRWLVASDPEEHLEQLRPYLELGFTHLVFHGPGDDQRGFIEHYAREILPRLRARWG